jgi:hypothetical protein
MVKSLKIKVNKAEKINLAKSFLDRVKALGIDAEVKGEWVVWSPPIPPKMALESMDISDEIYQQVASSASDAKLNHSLEIAECFDYSSLKYYCPWCGLKLTGGENGCHHEDENRAWGLHECEYEVGAVSSFGSHSQPISTTQVLELNILKGEQWLKDLPKLRKTKKQELADLQAALIKMNSSNAFINSII